MSLRKKMIVEHRECSISA